MRPLKNSIYFVLCLLLFSFLCAVISPTSFAKDTKKRDKKSFISFCQKSLDGSNKQLHYSMKTLTKISKTEDCAEIYAYLAKKKSLRLYKKKIKSLEFLSYFSGLEKLDLRDNKIKNIYPLSFLKKLKSLDISRNQILVIKPVSELTNLESLSFFDNKVKDLSAVKNLKSLRSLDVNSNEILSVNFLSKLTNLVSLNVSHNFIKNIDSLKNLKKLRLLNISYNQISVLEALRDIKSLEKIAFQHNAVQNLNALSSLSKLLVVQAGYNKLSSLVPLSFLQKLRILGANDNQIEDIEVLKKLINLKKLNLANNQIKDLKHLYGLKKLYHVNISDNPLKDPGREKKNLSHIKKLIMKKSKKKEPINLEKELKGKSDPKDIMAQMLYGGKKDFWSHAKSSSPYWLLLFLIYSVSFWGIFKKASYPKNYAFVPFYNLYLLMKVIGKPAWLLIPCFFPLLVTIFGSINPHLIQLTMFFDVYALIFAAVFMFIISNFLRKRFGCGFMFTFGLYFLPFLFLPILAFSKRKYIN